MVVRLVITGESQCEIFAKACLIADYLSQNLPNFCYERVEKSVLDWKAWLFKMNQRNKWHHIGSPLIWKEMLLKGSKPFYIGGASDLLEYCHSYYKFEAFLAPGKGLCMNFAQFREKIKKERSAKCIEAKKEKSDQQNFVVCISGAGNPIAMHLISGLLDMAVGNKNICKIYLYDSECSEEFMEFVERECSYVGNEHSSKVVKYVEKLGAALTNTDLLIVLDHVPFSKEASIGGWLHENRRKMAELALKINASARRTIYVLVPNLGPACYNATILTHKANIKKCNIVVATSDLGLEISPVAAEIAEVPLRNMFCPPVWGFVGVNQLVDIRTTVHRYDSFEPYVRYTKVRNSSLIIGSLTSELRTMEYLMYFDKSLWIKVAENKNKLPKKQDGINKAVAVLNVAKLWLFDKNPDHIVNLGIQCDGSFGLKFKGVFSQPSRFVDGEWRPVSNYILPKDPNMTLEYLEQMAELSLKMGREDLPEINPYFPCFCKKKKNKKKGVW